MTDDRMDARVKAAGARWRDDHGEAALVAVDETVTEDLTPPRPRRRRIGLWASVAAVAAVFLAGGAVTLANLGGGGGPAAGRENTSAPGAARLLDGTWTLTRVVQNGVNSGGTAAGAGGTDLSYQLRFTGREWAVTKGCPLGGPYSVQGQTLMLRDLSAVSCAVTDQPATSQPFFDVISANSPVQWRVDGHTLTLTRSGTTLAFERSGTGSAPPSARLDQVVGSWRLLSAETNTTDSSTGSGSSDSSYRLRFSGGQYVITAGCPTTGTYVGNDSQLTLTLAEAQPACGGAGKPSQVDKLVQSILATNGSVGWRIAGSILTVTRGDVTLTFVRRT